MALDTSTRVRARQAPCQRYSFDRVGVPFMDLIYDEQIGTGSWADVWRAHDNFGRPFAVKFFREDTPSRAEEAAMVHARALVRVSHPSIVKIWSVEEQPVPDSAADDRRMAIIMEYIEGPKLSLHRGALSPEHAANIIDEIADALECVHDAGMVHGDLHSGNILITATGAKLIDILYTHSLAEVGTTFAAKNRQDDVLEFAGRVREILAKTGIDKRFLAEAYFTASTEARSIEDVRAAFRVTDQDLEYPLHAKRVGTTWSTVSNIEEAEELVRFRAREITSYDRYDGGRASTEYLYQLRDGRYMVYIQYNHRGDYGGADLIGGSTWEQDDPPLTLREVQERFPHLAAKARLVPIRDLEEE